MLTGKELGRAIAKAIELKNVSKKEVADAFGVKPPSIQDWVNHGRISKSRISKLVSYFSDVVTVEHWGLEGLPSEDTPAQGRAHGNYIRFELLDVYAGAGPGYINNDFPQTVRLIEMTESEAVRLVGERGAKVAKLINISGDSMMPTIQPTDLLFVDPTVQHFGGDGVYIFVYDGSTYLKRLQKLARGKIAVISDNSAYKEWEIAPDDPTPWRIFGRLLRSLPMQVKEFA